jgi:uncharacterized protein
MNSLPSSASRGSLLQEIFRPQRSHRRLQTFRFRPLVLNLTNQCNLSCQYCYEFGADKVATPEGKPKFMNL